MRLPVLRLLPVLAGVAFVLFLAKVGAVWEGVSTARAETAAAAKPAVPPPAAHGSAVTPPVAAPAQPLATPAPQPAPVKPLVPATVSMSDAEQAVLEEIAKRRRELENWSAEIDRREALLKAAEQRIDAKVAELTALKAELQKLAGTVDAKQESEIKSLVKIYETMKPKDAAKIFEKLDMPIVLDLAGRMKDLKLASILAAMEPDKAKTITTEMARRPAITAQAKP